MTAFGSERLRWDICEMIEVTYVPDSQGKPTLDSSRPEASLSQNLDGNGRVVRSRYLVSGARTAWQKRPSTGMTYDYDTQGVNGWVHNLGSIGKPCNHRA